VRKWVESKKAEKDSQTASEIHLGGKGIRILREERKLAGNLPQNEPDLTTLENIREA